MKKVAKAPNSVILIVCSILIIISTVLFSIKIFATNEVETVSVIKEIEVIKNNNPVNINEILSKNVSEEIVQEMVVEEIDLEYTTEYRQNASLPKGTIQVLQEGRDGKQNAIIIKKYSNGELISEELVAENLLKASINKIVEIGAGSGTNVYEATVGDTVFVTSQLLAVRLEPNRESEKLCTLKKDTKVKIEKVEGDWLYISSKEHNGYIDKECITNIDPNNMMNMDMDVMPGDTYSKNTLLAKLNFNMNLNNPSGFSLEQFKKVLEGQAADTNNVFKENAEYFYYAEKQYGLNGIFLAAVGIHESGWGTSRISLDKRNLFGYGAYDSNPYGGAYSFNTYAEGIDLLARVFVKYYLNPKDTVIYDGNVANGKYYNGNTVSSINIKYASDKNWANSVYKWMQHLYNSL